MTFDTAEPLDDMGRRMLAELRADGRVTLAKLGRRVALPAPVPPPPVVPASDGARSRR